MPPNRTDPMAVTNETAAPAPAYTQAPSAGMKAWLPLGVTVLVMPLLAYFMTTAVILPRLQKSLTATVAAATDPATKPAAAAPAFKKESVAMNKLLVNVAGTMGGRYLLVSLAVAGMDPNFKTRVTELEPQLRDVACSTLAAKTLADLEKPGARNLIRAELVSSFNNILGAPLVQEVYLTEFAIQ